MSKNMVRRVNPVLELGKGLQGIKKKIQEMKKVEKPAKTYGLGAFLPPKDLALNAEPSPQVIPKLSFKPLNKDSTLAPYLEQRVLVNSDFFEIIVMLIIIFWLLKWLFGF